MDPSSDATVVETDAVVIGAGPVGLWQVFQCGLLGLRCHVVDVLPEVGGQCIELYADKLLYDIPGLPPTCGRDFAAQLQQQVQPFEPVFHLGCQVTALTRQADGRFDLSTSGCSQVLRCRHVFIAAGVGAFLPRKLPLAGLDRYTPASVTYHQLPTDGVSGRHIVIVGGEDAALQMAVDLASGSDGRSDNDRPASVTLLHRRDQFSSDDGILLARFDLLRRSGLLQVCIGQPVEPVESAGPGGPVLAGLRIAPPEGDEFTLPLDRLIVCLGLSPRLGPIADWGLVMERKQLTVDTARFETSVPGIYAVGDVVTYPGKRKLIACGFHEAILAAFAAAERDRGGPVPLEYTTSSKTLQGRLGVRDSVTNAS